MTSNKVARTDSTLLSVIAQAKARGANFTDVSSYFERLTLPSSKKLAQAMFGTANEFLDRVSNVSGFRPQELGHK